MVQRERPAGCPLIRTIDDFPRCLCTHVSVSKGIASLVISFACCVIYCGHFDEVYDAV